MAGTVNQLTLTRCGVCGIYAPQKIGYGGKIVSAPCAHRAWRHVQYNVAEEGQELIPVPRSLLVRVLLLMMQDAEQVNSEWRGGSVCWEQEKEVSEVAELLGLQPGEWPEVEK
jgi:hypothetical protein